MDEIHIVKIAENFKKLKTDLSEDETLTTI